MNLGQFISAKSPLQNGTVAQHLAAIAELHAGSGQGTVFASRFTVAVEMPSFTVTRKAKRTVQGEAQVAPVVQRDTAKPQKNVAVFSITPSAIAFTAPDELTVFSTTQRTVAMTRLASETITRQSRRTA